MFYHDANIAKAIRGGHDVVIFMRSQPKIVDGDLTPITHSTGEFSAMTSVTMNNVDFLVGVVKHQRHRQIRVLGGAQDVIKAAPDIILYCLAAAAHLKFKLDPNLYFAIKGMVTKISKIDKEAKRKYVSSIVMSAKPSKSLTLMHNLGVLMILMPELDVCYGVPQNKRYHEHDVFKHCVFSCDKADMDMVIRFAALLHDIGKPVVRKETVNNGESKITFYSHEVVGARLARKVLKRLGFDKSFITKVSTLVYNHMYNYEPEKWSDATVLRFMKKAGIEGEFIDRVGEFPLFRVRAAERMSHPSNVHPTSYRQAELEKNINRILKAGKELSAKDLCIDGHTLMKELDLQPGPLVGKILKHLLEKAKGDISVNTEQKLLKIARAYLLNE